MIQMKNVTMLLAILLLFCVPAAFPATALWRFRLASVGVQAVLWATLGIGFGALTERREATP